MERFDLMDLVSATLRWQRVAVYVAVAGTALLFWRGAADTFALPKATLLWLVALVVVGIFLVRVALERVLRLPRSSFAIAVAALLVAVVLSTIASPNPALSIIGEYERYTGLLGYASFAVIALVTLRAFDVDESVLLLRVITVATGLVGMYGVLQLLNVDPFDWPSRYSNAAFANEGNPNQLAGFLAIGVPAALWVSLTGTSSRTIRMVAAASAALGIVALIGSRSFQGPLAVLPAALFVLVTWMTTDAGHRARGLVAARVGRARVAVLLAVTIVAAGGAIGFATLARAGLRNGLIERGDFWRTALTMFRRRPVLGVGFDTYGQHFLALRPASHAVRLGFTQAESAHSVPLNLLAGGGVVVAAAWMAVVVATGLALVKGLRRLEGEERLLLGGLGGAWVAYLVQSAVSFDVPHLLVLHAALAGSIVAIGAPPHWIDVRLPGRPVGVRGRGRQQRMDVPASTYVVGAISCAALLVAASFAVRPLRADGAVAHAADQVDAREGQSALKTLARATELAPWQGRYWVLRAQASEAAANVFDSADLATEAARREPGSARYALLAADLTARYRKPRDAQALYREALRRDPHDPYILASVARGIASFEPKAALRLATEALATAPRLADAWLARGLAYEKQGAVDDAVDAFRRALELDATSTTAKQELVHLGAASDEAVAG